MSSDLAERLSAAIQTTHDLADEHHLGQCTVWTEGWRLKPGPCTCNGPSDTRRRCDADKRIVQRYQRLLALGVDWNDTMGALTDEVGRIFDPSRRGLRNRVTRQLDKRAGRSSY